MQAMILAAGRGSRLGGFTDELPKCLVDVGGKPILHRQLGMLQDLGIRDVVVVTGYRREQVEAAARLFPGTRTVHNPFWSLTNVIGSAWFGLQAVTDSMLYFHGDTLTDPAILQAVIAHQGAMVLPFDAHPCADEEMKVRLESGRLVEINKTMDPARAAGEFLGVCSIQGSFLATVRAIVDEELEHQRFQGFFEVAIQQLVNRGQGPVEVVDVSGHFWREIDTPADLETARRHFQPGGTS
jgi:choline kinase